MTGFFRQWHHIQVTFEIPIISCSSEGLSWIFPTAGSHSHFRSQIHCRSRYHSRCHSHYHSHCHSHSLHVHSHNHYRSQSRYQLINLGALYALNWWQTQKTKWKLLKQPSSWDWSWELIIRIVVGAVFEPNNSSWWLLRAH